MEESVIDCRWSLISRPTALGKIDACRICGRKHSKREVGFSEERKAEGLYERPYAWVCLVGWWIVLLKRRAERLQKEKEEQEEKEKQKEKQKQDE